MLCSGGRYYLFCVCLEASSAWRSLSAGAWKIVVARRVSVVFTIGLTAFWNACGLECFSIVLGAGLIDDCEDVRIVCSARKNKRLIADMHAHKLCAGSVFLVRAYMTCYRLQVHPRKYHYRCGVKQAGHSQRQRTQC